eukprot:CAMPEP_0202708204 /NCGR_PEP_ID=MMETSP1385-20130828/20454_1 /ASSEMBLY_ACC=CAM_ASM_000861 /TAXON_ID=933848 /ORGANISM="Elphidium margaritaceum" /LENGTH=375 /DNA_ID=CAMNT_0049367121 /DNA_START=54 /DNA_END=1181 /DNA_ORIENTATION=+
MENQNYKYFETNPHPSLQANGGGFEQHVMEMSHVADPSLHASPFWRCFPHVMGFILVYLFGAIYFNDAIFYYFPIMFFFPMLIFIFICLPKQYMFVVDHIPVFVNNLSWSFWIALSVYIVVTALNATIPLVIAPAAVHEVYHETHDFWQAQIVFTALVTTAFLDEAVRCWLCNRCFQVFYGIGNDTTSVNSLILNCALNGCGIAIAKGFVALAIIGNTLPTETGDAGDASTVELIYDYKFALLHFVPKAFIYNTALHPVFMMVMYGLCLVPFHAMMGALWGIGFVRRFVLEHTVAFAQILMFPWFFGFVVNLVIAEVFYNVIDGEFSDSTTMYTVVSVTPVLITLIATAVFYALFKRQIDRSISKIHAVGLLQVN